MDYTSKVMIELEQLPDEGTHSRIIATVTLNDLMKHMFRTMTFLLWFHILRRKEGC